MLVAFNRHWTILCRLYLLCRMRLQNLQNPPNAGAAFNLPRPVSLHFISSRPRQQQQRSCGAVALFGFGRSSPSDGGSSGGGAPSTSSTLPSAATTSSVQLPRTAAAQVEQAAAAVQAALDDGRLRQRLDLLLPVVRCLRRCCLAEELPQSLPCPAHQNILTKS